MRLADFIRLNTVAIVDQWERFAASLPPAADMDSLDLRDHAKEILHAIATDLETHQSREEQIAKSLGRKIPLIGAPETAAQTHAILRAKSGFDINQLAAEYRALRASVLRLWFDAYPRPAVEQLDQMMRFHEAVDEALAESIGFFHAQVEQARNLLLGMLGHDLRSPLNSIQMTATFLSEIQAGAEVSAAAARLINSGSRMQALLDDLMDFNRTNLGVSLRLRPASIDASALLADEVDLLRSAHPACQLELSVQGETVGFWDGMRLRQILNNLVENAIRYGDASPVQVIVTGGDGHLVIAVRNSGHPIDRSAMKSIFDPLKRRATQESSTDSRAGLGLGLYIARHIAEAHGGSIEVNSDEKRTVFVVKLPTQKLSAQEQSR